MSDQLTPVDESTLDPAIIKHFEAKYAPVVSKKDEFLGKYGALKSELDALGGLDTVKSLAEQAKQAQSKAEQERLAKLSADDRLKEIEETYKRQIGERDEKLTKWQQRAVNREVDAALAEAIRAEDGNPVLLSHALKSRVEATMNDDGEVVVTVKGPNGEALDSKGKPFTLKGLVAEFKGNADFAGAFKANPANGGGTQRGSKTVGGGNNPFAEATKNLTEQMRLIKTQPELARALAAEAGVKAEW